MGALPGVRSSFRNWLHVWFGIHTQIANTPATEAGKKVGNLPHTRSGQPKSSAEGAAEIGIEGHSEMTKDQLIDALRNH